MSTVSVPKCYVTWAEEMLHLILSKIYDPYLASHLNDVADALALKLKSDLEGVIVPDWFCADCEEKRDCDNCEREPKYNEGYL